MTTRPKRSRNLPDACVREALAIIEESGLETLSLRDVARRLGVSHQAPYKHFPSRDHLLAEVVSRAFAAFAAYLDTRDRSDDPAEDLSRMGQAYLSYALTHPLQYRLMFGTNLPDPDKHLAMMEHARHAFALLQQALGRMPGTDGSQRPVDADALFVWAAMHGLATIAQTSALATLGLAPSTLAEFFSHSCARIEQALQAPAIDLADKTGSTVLSRGSP